MNLLARPPMKSFLTYVNLLYVAKGVLERTTDSNYKISMLCNNIDI